MKVNVQNLERKLRKSLNMLNTIKGTTIYVGITEPELAEKALLNEYGCWNENANRMNPARPFLGNTFKGRSAQNIINKVRSEMTGLIDYANSEKGMLATISSKKERTREAMERIAKYAANEVKLTIGDGDFVPNAEATVKKKHHSTVLVDTGMMKKAIKGWVE